MCIRICSRRKVLLIIPFYTHTHTHTVYVRCCSFFPFNLPGIRIYERIISKCVLLLNSVRVAERRAKSFSTVFEKQTSAYFTVRAFSKNAIERRSKKKLWKKYYKCFCYLPYFFTSRDNLLFCTSTVISQLLFLVTGQCGNTNCR